MAYPEEVKNEVRKSFVQGMPLAKVAKLHDIPYDTCRAWKRSYAKKGDDWDIAKAARVTRDALANDNQIAQFTSDFASQFQATLKEISADSSLDVITRAELLTKLSDAFIKFSNAANRNSPKIAKLTVAADVIKRFTVLVEKNHREVLSEFVEIAEQLSQELSRDY